VIARIVEEVSKDFMRWYEEEGAGRWDSGGGKGREECGDEWGKNLKKLSLRWLSQNTRKSGGGEGSGEGNSVNEG